jgi:hypothetical protein
MIRVVSSTSSDDLCAPNCRPPPQYECTNALGIETPPRAQSVCRMAVDNPDSEITDAPPLTGMSEEMDSMHIDEAAPTFHPFSKLPPPSHSSPNLGLEPSCSSPCRGRRKGRLFLRPFCGYSHQSVCLSRVTHRSSEDAPTILLCQFRTAHDPLQL